MRQRSATNTLALGAVVVLLCTLARSLHLTNHQSQASDDAQLEYLMSLQNNFKSQIGNLSIELASVRSSLERAGNLSEQIQILEPAIIRERQQIASFKNGITPDSTNRALPCQVLSEEEQASLAENAAQLASDISQLEQLTKLVPQCDQIDAINREILKMKADLRQAQDLILNNCQQHYISENTVYQSNLYNNSNWTLGGMTMTSLIDQFNNRSLKYANISNCPLDRPFYTGATPADKVSACIACTQPKPYFNLKTRACVSCPPEMQISSIRHECESIPKNSNFNAGTNYVLAPLKLMPLPNASLANCTKEKPFFNGTYCVACLMPDHYWNISAGACQQCVSPMVFNLNMKACLEKEQNMLTILFGKDWVTNDGNVTRVLSERLEVLQKNKTTGVYRYCPELKPFYDDSACIFCPEGQIFNVDSKICTSAPLGLKYDPNVRQYIPPEAHHETDPKSPNYISNSALTDTESIPNCNNTHPYYDTVACINCQAPFLIFDVDAAKCSLCDAVKIYNATTHKCDQRNFLYVNGSSERLMATKARSIEDYRAGLTQAVKQNPQALPVNCENSTHYAAITRCIACSAAKKEYFNVETLQCEVCDGSVEATSKLCHERTYYLPNLESPKVVLPDNMSLDQARSSLEQIQNNSDKQFQICPLANPAAFQNQTLCSKCPDTTPLYNFTSQQCTKCETGKKYDPETRHCRVVYMLTDLDQKVLVQAPKTISDYLNQETQLNSTQLTEKCPNATPYTADNKLCFACNEPAPLFNLSSGLCTRCDSPLIYDSPTRECLKIHYLTDLTSERLLEEDNYTIPAVRDQQRVIMNDPSQTHQICPPERPYGEETGCVDCLEEDSYFNLKTLSCQRCAGGSRYWAATHRCEPIRLFSNINATQAKYVQDAENTLAQVQNDFDQQSQKGPTGVCPEGTPYYGLNAKNISECMACPPEAPYFILATDKCGVCNNYSPETQTCPPKPPRFPNLTNYFWISNQYSADQVITKGLELQAVFNSTECPAFYNPITRDCIECSSSLYFNYDTLKCEVCPAGTVFDINVHVCAAQTPAGTYYTNIEESASRELLYGGLTIGELQGTQKETKQMYPDSKYCPVETPYYDGIQCIMCPSYKKYFNLRYDLCQVCMFDETLDVTSHNCLDSTGVPVWRKPEAKLVYPYLFGQKPQ